MKRARDIFSFQIEAASHDEPTCLVTLTHVDGSSSRAPGTHMAVSATGGYVGSMSGGCVEAAIVSEALRILQSGVTELIRFGAGSRYLDIRLPCGGGIDLLFTPAPPLSVLLETHNRLVSRRSASLVLGMDGTIVLAPDGTTKWEDSRFCVRHDPDLSLVIVGHGAETEALARLALAYSADVRVFSPDAQLVERLSASSIEAIRLRSPTSCAGLAGDTHTAIVFLFHDHDWEPVLLRQALDTDAFFIGAMGSHRMHAQRCTALREAGVSEAAITRTVGPLGLIPATRDPETLALSALSQIVAWQHRGQAVGAGDSEKGEKIDDCDQ